MEKLQELKEAIQAWFTELMEDKRKLMAIGAVALALIVAIVLMVTVRSNARTVRYQNSLNDGWEYMDAADYENAVSKFESAYTVKDTEDAAMALAQALYAAGNTEKAIEVLE